MTENGELCVMANNNFLIRGHIPSGSPDLSRDLVPPNERRDYHKMGETALESEIERFLQSSEAEVLVISGKWGIGKTFIWNNVLRSARKKNRGIFFNKYSYVSLFGLNDLNEVRQAIFENTVNREDAGNLPDLTSFNSSINSMKTNWRKILSGSSPILSSWNLNASFERISFLTVSNQIVCFDDLERKSKSLYIRDILGLTSFLKEQRNCKVAIILNEDWLGDEYDEFCSQLEKIADTIMRYEPSPEYVIDLCLSDTTFHRDVIESACRVFGILNLRTINRIKKNAQELKRILNGYDERITRQAIQSSSLFTYSKAQPDTAPTIDFLKGYDPGSTSSTSTTDDRVSAKWREMLQDYNFLYLDEFDSVLMNNIISGYFNADEIIKAADLSKRRFDHSDSEFDFQNAWNLYHDSFADNRNEVIQSLIAVIQSSPYVVTPTNLSGSITLLKELNWDGDIYGIISNYIEARDEGREFWDLTESAFGDAVRDEDVRKAFATKLHTFDVTRNPEELLKKIGETRGWHKDDVRFLAQQETETYRSIFKSLSGKDLRKALRGALIFKNIASSTEEMDLITARAEEALRLIAAESTINRRRVSQLGVDLNPPPPLKGE